MWYPDSDQAFEVARVKKATEEVEDGAMASAKKYAEVLREAAEKIEQQCQA